jgi:hypothetical protein
MKKLTQRLPFSTTIQRDEETVCEEERYISFEEVMLEPISFVNAEYPSSSLLRT